MIQYSGPFKFTLSKHGTLWIIILYKGLVLSALWALKIHIVYLAIPAMLSILDMFTSLLKLGGWLALAALLSLHPPTKQYKYLLTLAVTNARDISGQPLSQQLI